VTTNVAKTKKPTDVRMGKGKGNIHSRLGAVKSGQILFELDQISLEFAKEILVYGQSKLSLKTKLILKKNYF